MLHQTLTLCPSCGIESESEAASCYVCGRLFIHPEISGVAEAYPTPSTAYLQVEQQYPSAETYRKLRNRATVKETGPEND